MVSRRRFLSGLTAITASPTNLLGAKGAGEAGTTGAIPTLANAVIDALRPLGIHHLDFPYSPPRIGRAIASGSRTHSLPPSISWAR